MKNLSATIADLNQQNADIARTRQDLKNQTIKAYAFAAGMAVDYVATVATLYTRLKK